MARRTILAEHLSSDELERRYRQCKHPHEKIRWQALWLLSTGMTATQLAPLVGYHASTIGTWVKHYNAQGPDGLHDHRRERCGHTTLLDQDAQDLLRQALNQPHPDGGLWNGPKVRLWIQEYLGRTVPSNLGWRYLKRLGLTPQTPRPRSHKADPAQQAAFKNELPQIVAQIQEQHPEQTIELWAQDEQRVGTKPIIRKVWAEKGKRPLVLQHRGYKWLYVYGFVHPSSGRTETWLMPSVNVDSFGCVLEAFAKATGAGEGKQVVVVLDRAGWHTSSQVELPPGLHLVFQPASSPELQPAEHLWGLISEVLANKLLKTIDEVEQLVAQRCIWMGEQLELIRSRTLFSWWPSLY